ncbi:MAG TPA: hypothetical protein DEF45_19515 [Rhodopirellula sp.]|nr:hypothetical protein [Rhodopirellula sp.]
MSIELKASGFYEWGEPPEGSLGVDTSRIDECIAYYHERGFRALFGHESFGFRQDNLDFLTRVKNATALWFWDVSLKDIDGIYELMDLESFGVHPKRPGIDFSRFHSLRTAFCHWNKSDTGIVASTIAEYRLWHCKPRSKSFERIEIPKAVTKLELTWANPSTLDGLPVLKKLKVLEIHRCRNLQDLSCLPRIAPNLQRLLTTTSSKIDASSGVLDHPKLKEALVDGNFVVGESG